MEREVEKETGKRMINRDGEGGRERDRKEND